MMSHEYRYELRVIVFLIIRVDLLILFIGMCIFAISLFIRNGRFLGLNHFFFFYSIKKT